MNAETGSVSYDNLVLSDVPAISDNRTLENGAVVSRGAILKLGTGTKLAAFDEYDSATDAFAIAATDGDATDGDTPIRVYTFGQFSAAAVAEATGLASISVALKNALWARGLHVRDTLSLD